MILRTALLALGIFWGICSGAQAEDTDSEVFIHANRAYQEERYGEAEKGYQRLLEGNKVNGHLHYNLGNTFYRQGKTGLAIWHYLKATTLLPRDEDVEANLKLALRETADIWDGRRTPGYAVFFFWLEGFNFREHLLALLLLNFSCWMLWGINLAKKNEGLDTARKILAGLTVVAFLACGARWSLETDPGIAVVQEKSLEAVSSNSQTGKVLFQFHEGAVLAVLSQSGGWVEVELPSGERGWVKKSGLLL